MKFIKFQLRLLKCFIVLNLINPTFMFAQDPNSTSTMTGALSSSSPNNLVALVSPFYGSASMRIPVEIPASRGLLTPNMALVYNST